MVDATVPKTPKGRYYEYTPGAIRHDVPGLVHKRLDSERDLFAGTGDVLLAAGVVTADMFPAAGRGKIAWRPAGEKAEGSPTWTAPGYLELRKLPDGRFSATLTVRARQRLEEDIPDIHDVASPEQAKLVVMAIAHAISQPVERQQSAESSTSLAKLVWTALPRRP